MNKTKMKKVIVGCEPTGCYWLTFQKFLLDHDIQLVKDGRFSTSYLPGAIYAVLQTGCEFDEERFRRDIIRPEAA